jgi:hypothetical protein
MYYRSLLEVAGPDPRHAAEVLGLPDLRMVSPDGANIFADIRRGRWLRLVDVSVGITMEPSAQIAYWCSFLEARIGGVRDLQSQANRFTIYFWIDTPYVDFDLPLESMRRLNGLSVGLHFTFYVHKAANDTSKRRSSGLLWHPMKHSDDVADYLLDQLRGTAAREKVRERIEAREGRFFVILPEDEVADVIDGWDHCSPVDGLGYPVDPSPLLYDVVRRFLRLDPQSRILGQNSDTLSSRPDAPTETDLVVSHEVPGWELRGPDASDAEIETLSRETGRFPFVLFFYRSNSPKRATLDDRDVDELAENLVGLAVGAFLEDTYLIWWRTDLVQFPGDAVASLPENPESTT